LGQQLVLSSTIFPREELQNLEKRKIWMVMEMSTVKIGREAGRFVQ
jgi:hypothetical protein